MPSPFPGMDPYLEEPRRWPDVLQSLITYIRDALKPAVRPRYFARMVEIDLLAAGLPTLFVAQSDLVAPPPAPPHRYLISVRRGTEPDRFETYPISLPNRLPRIRAPLNAPDPDVVLDVQMVFDRCYDNGDYADLIDYHKDPTAPLSSGEATWLNALLQGKGWRVAT